ncbi:MAG: hypothetical protein ACFFAJ_17225 [Candidatus Hodarchaeota archaeon]
MSVLAKIISHLEQVHESTILEMTQIATELDRNRLSGFLRACEEVGIIESVGKASHRKYRLKNDYMSRIDSLLLKSEVIKAPPEGRKRWHYPYKKQLKERNISWSDEIPGGT